MADFVDVLPRRHFRQTRQHRLFQQGRLVGGHNQAPALVERCQLLALFSLDRRQSLARAASSHVLHLPAQRLGLDRLAHIGETQADGLKLVVVEFPGLDQHLLAHADFPEVVQHPRIFDLAQVFAREVQSSKRAFVDRIHVLGQGYAQGGHPARMAGCGRIARLDSGDRGVDETLEQAVDFVVQDRVLQRHARLRRQRQRHLLRTLVERDHAFLEIGRGGQHLARPALLVDELDDPDDLALGRQHGHGQHRARAVADLVVEAAIVRAGPGGRRGLPNVGHVDWPTGQHRATRHRGIVNRQGELLEVHLDRIVLREHEVQPGRMALQATRRGKHTAPADLSQSPRQPRGIAEGQAVGLAVAVGVGRLQHVHAAGVSAGYAPTPVKDQVQQLANISLGRQGA